MTTRPTNDPNTHSLPGRRAPHKENPCRQQKKLRRQSQLEQKCLELGEVRAGVASKTIAVASGPFVRRSYFAETLYRDV